MIPFLKAVPGVGFILNASVLCMPFDNCTFCWAEYSKILPSCHLTKNVHVLQIIRKDEVFHGLLWHIIGKKNDYWQMSQLGLMFEQLHRHFQPSARASWSRASQSDSRILTATAATATDPQADHLGSQRSLRNALSFYRGPRAHNPAPILTAAGNILLAHFVETPTQRLVDKTKRAHFICCKLCCTVDD